MPWVRYAVADEYWRQSLHTVDWGTEIHRDPQYNIRVYETWVDSQEEAHRLLSYASATGGYVNQWQEQLWADWNTTTTTNRIYVRPRPPSEEAIAERRRLDEERAAEYQRRNVEMRRQEVEVRRRQAESKARAEHLLRLVLTDAEWEQFSDHDQRAVTFTGSDGMLYRVRCAGYEGNVEVLDRSEQVLATMCCHPNMYLDGSRLPVADAWAAQILALKFDADSFLATANVDCRWVSHEATEFYQRHEELREQRREAAAQHARDVRERQYLTGAA